jgi:SAM-dependent methyltransferase
VIANAEALPFADRSLDRVITGFTVRNVGDLPRALREFRRVLRPGGRLVGSVPNAYRLKNRLRFLLGRPPERDPTHLQMFRPADVRRLLDAFEAVELRFVVGRLAPLNGRLFANDVVFSARKPR